MSEGLGRKKRIRGGHRSSATRTISEIYETIESTADREPVITKLMQCKLTLKEKLDTIKRYDDEILGLVEDGEVEDEIDQADIFNERVQRAIIDATSAIDTKRSEHDTVPTPFIVESSATAAATSTVVTSTPAGAPSLSVTTATISVPATEVSDISLTTTSVTSTPITLSSVLSGSLLASTTVPLSVPPGITASLSTTPSASIVGLPVTPAVFSTPLLLSSSARTTLTSDS